MQLAVWHEAIFTRFQGFSRVFACIVGYVAAIVGYFASIVGYFTSIARYFWVKHGQIPIYEVFSRISQGGRV